MSTPSSALSLSLSCRLSLKLSCSLFASKRYLHPLTLLSLPLLLFCIGLCRGKVPFTFYPAARLPRQRSPVWGLSRWPLMEGFFMSQLLWMDGPLPFQLPTVWDRRASVPRAGGGNGFVAEVSFTDSSPRSDSSGRVAEGAKRGGGGGAAAAEGGGRAGPGRAPRAVAAPGGGSDPLPWQRPGRAAKPPWPSRPRPSPRPHGRPPASPPSAPLAAGAGMPRTPPR